MLCCPASLIFRILAATSPSGCSSLWTSITTIASGVGTLVMSASSAAPPSEWWELPLPSGAPLGLPATLSGHQLITSVVPNHQLLLLSPPCLLMPAPLCTGGLYPCWFQCALPSTAKRNCVYFRVEDYEWSASSAAFSKLQLCLSP